MINQMIAIVGYVLICYLLADLLAGFWHWIEDRYFEEHWPLIGEYVAKPNNLHHKKPTAFLVHSYWQRNWTTLLPAAIGFLLTFPNPLCLVFLFVSQANEIHAWAHSKGKVSSWIAALQRTGLIQSPKHHADHHRNPFDVKYCVMSDWLNPILDHVQFWHRLERVIHAVTGLRPKKTAAA